MAKEKWMQSAVKRPQALRSKAKKGGGLNKEGKIKSSFLTKEEHSENPRTRKQAVLAKTFAKFRKK